MVYKVTTMVKMLGLQNMWPLRIDHFIDTERGLNDKEINYIRLTLKVKVLREFMSLRYGPHPTIYDNMIKEELLHELRLGKYEERLSSEDSSDDENEESKDSSDHTETPLLPQPWQPDLTIHWNE